MYRILVDGNLYSKVKQINVSMNGVLYFTDEHGTEHITTLPYHIEKEKK